MSAVYAPLPISPAFVNPAHMNPTPGPSSPPPKKKPASCSKRKRTDTPDDSGHESATQPRKARDGPKKKKANRACFHCQKAHLTCDDSRPCQRCTKRGIASSCTEGHRKKAKYLLDEDELEQLKRAKSSAPETTQEPVVSVNPVPNPTETDVLLSSSFDPTFTFGSEAANLEYSILSAILGNPSPDSITSPPSPDPTQSYSSWAAETVDFTTSPTLGSLASFTTSYADSHLVQSADPPLPSSPSNPTQYLTYPYTSQQQSRSDEINIDFSNQGSQPIHPLKPRYPLENRPRSPPTGVFLHESSENLGNNGATPESDADTPASSTSQLQSIHDRVTKPYDYTEGYHFLMKHLPTRFEKNDILRIVRALAIFRPSLIALQMPLSLDDEVFVEKCFQRSLLELEKLMSFSGTPTVVWRRTGEICLVAPEFCMLTEWPMEDLMGGQKYIYELFENQSVVEYWENFAAHAFENTTQSVYSHCVLLKPSGAPVPATFCFSIRRDLFDLPSMVIGQWLPLL
ncbi:Transcriptional regulator of nonfermentable carbon utilization [Tricholoma furcatifolium]|nr:Transcriptional regulator of nonfermentable carbon utilization [Tricholoma furcatifolium]